jgi:TATA-binding protein-associated factor
MHKLIAECNDQLLSIHNGNQLLFVEIQANLLELRQKAETLLKLFSDSGCQTPKLPSIPSDPNPVSSELGLMFTADVAETINTSLFGSLLDSIHSDSLTPELFENLHNKNSNLNNSLKDFYIHQEGIEIIYMSSLANLLVSSEYFPEKQNHVIRSLLNSIKKEPDFNFQQRSAEAMSDLIYLNSKKGGKSLSINEKIVKHLSNMLCNDPEFILKESVDALELEVMTWVKLQSELEAKKDTSKKSKGSKKPSMLEDINGDDNENQTDQSIEYRGGLIVFRLLSSKFGPALFSELSTIRSLISFPLITFKNDPTTRDSIQAAVHAMLLLQYIIPFLDKEVLDKEITPLVEIICEFCRHNVSLVRYCACTCLGNMCRYLTFPSMKAVIEYVMPFLADSKTLVNRLGAAEAVYQILELMKDDVLPYIVFLIVPILKRMSDPDPNVRFLCSNIFAKLVKLVPLEKGIPNPDGFSPEMIKQKEDERKFMGQLVGSERVEDFSLNVDIAAELRPYQKDGVNWLAFLNRYGLHGILCDGRIYLLII